MPRPAARILFAIALAAVAALVLTACGGSGGSGGKDETAGLTPAQILSRSSAAARELHSFRVAIDGTGSADVSGADSSIPGAGLLKGPLRISAEGPVQPPDRVSLDAKLGIGGPSLQVNVTRVGDGVYLGLLGTDYSVDVPRQEVGLLDLGALYPTLAGWMTDPKEAGRADVGGDPTVEIAGAIDPAKALADLGPLLGGGSVTPAQARRALKSGTVEAWIGTEDLRPRKVHVVLSADGAGVAQGVGAVTADITATLSDFDAPVDIPAPKDAKPLDLSSLGGLVGG
jgi:hypothetical protein